MLDVDGSIDIGMRAVTTDHTAKRLLVGPVGSVYIMTHAALLGGIGTLDFGCSYLELGSIPGDVLGDVCEIGGVQVGVHGTRLVLHGGDRQVFVGELAALVLLKALVHRPVDRLPYVAGEPLSALAARGGEFFHPFLLQALAQLRLAPPFLPVALLPLPQFAMKGAVVLPVAGGQEVGDAHVYADHRGRRHGVYRDDLVVGERQPPAISALVARDAGVDSLVLERLAVVGRHV